MTEALPQAIDLLKVLNRLIEVLQQEVHMLREMDPSGMQSLQQDKIVLTAAYESMVAKLRERPEALRGLDAGLRDQIMSVTSRFQNTLTENARALFAVKEANDRLFKALVKGIEEQRIARNTYSASGTLAGADAAGGGMSMPVAFDQRL